MTFDAGVPNSGQSPAFFPTQNQTNMGRIKAIINAEHVFNDTAAANDGTHKQVTLKNRSTPVGFPAGTNAVLYSKVDSDGASQLHFYNGATDVQLTPLSVGPIRVQGTTIVAIAPNATFNITGLPAQYVGTGYVFVNGTKNYSFNNVFLVNGQADEHRIEQGPENPPFINSPSFTFSGTTLRVRNNNSIASILVWSLILNVIP